MASTWFTVRRMKRLASSILILDLFLLVFWLGVAFYLIVNLEQECFHLLTVEHFLIVIHFALGMYISNMIATISLEEHQAKLRGERLVQLPYYTYLPLSWAFTTLISLTSDAVAVAWSSRLYLLETADSPCLVGRQLNIALVVIALVISFVTMIWFILFGIYAIEDAKTRKKV